MGKCEICLENESKYKCPRCFIGTCCLQCVQRHKIERDCNGVRDKTAFVELKEFNDRHLLNDYRLLEETGRKVDSTTRDELKRRRDKPNFLRELKRQAKKRKVNLQLMPYPMQKRKSNYTTFQIKSQTILWQIEWVFPKSDATYTDRRISETLKLKDLLKRYIDPTESDPVCRQKLKVYNQRGLDSCNLYMKVEGQPANCPRYYKLDKDLSVAENLSEKIVIEYPTIYVDFDKCPEYTVLETEGTGSGDMQVPGSVEGT